MTIILNCDWDALRTDIERPLRTIGVKVSKPESIAEVVVSAVRGGRPLGGAVYDYLESDMDPRDIASVVESVTDSVASHFTHNGVSQLIEDELPGIGEDLARFRSSLKTIRKHNT